MGQKKQIKEKLAEAEVQAAIADLKAATGLDIAGAPILIGSLPLNHVLF